MTICDLLRVVSVIISASIAHSLGDRAQIITLSRRCLFRWSATARPVLVGPPPPATWHRHFSEGEAGVADGEGTIKAVYVYGLKATCF